MDTSHLFRAGFSVHKGLLQRLAWILAVPFLLVLKHHVSAEEPPSPKALLRGVEMARTKHDSLKAALEIRYRSPAPAKTIECLVEMDGIKRRFEVLAGEMPGEVVIRDGNEFHGFRRKENEDVHVYDERRAVGVRGDIAFDPRILGLSDLMPCNVTVRECLWYERADSLKVVGRESLRGVSAWRVKATRRQDTAEYWIEEPSFRVHRKIIETPHMRIEIDSEFSSSEPHSPFPRRVVAKRDYTRSDRSDDETIYIVKSLDIGANVPPERFTLGSMDLPINTPVVDYRISRIVGYWNGEGLSERPVYLGERPSTPSSPESEWTARLLIIGLNAIVVLVLLAIVWWRKRHVPSE